MAPRPGELAKAVESVLLKPVTTAQDLDAACDEALAGHIAALCVLPVHVAHAAERLKGGDVKVVAMISFPFGADTAEVKAAAAERALADGADDLEVMMGLQRFLSGEVNETRDELAAIVRASRLRTLSNGRRPAQVRAVVETSYLDDRRIRLAARVVHAAGVDMVVTSSGLGPRSTSVLDVELLREEVGGTLSIKAAGGVRTHAEAVEMIAAGANRVGATQIAPLLETSRGVKIDEVPVDQVGVAARVTWLAKRSIKTTAKAEGLRLALSMIDLTTLEGKDSDGKVRRLVAKAQLPDPSDPTLPQCAAVCVYPTFVRLAKELTAGSGVRVASVATAFPSGHAPLATRIAEVEAAVADGADEIDMVIDRGAFLSGQLDEVAEEIVLVKQACRDAHLKVILETGELETLDNVRRASLLAMRHGADFIKTSTGKVSPAATPSVVLVMLEAIRDYSDETGRMVGMKPAGGIRDAKSALTTLVIVKETLGEAWLTPEWFRFGASSLTNDLLMQLQKLRTGAYASPDSFSAS